MEREREIFVAEGTTVVRRLLRSSLPVRSVLAIPTRVDRVRDDAAARDVPVLEVAPDVVEAVVGFDLHRGVLAIGERPPDRAVPEVSEAESLLVLERIGDHENLGALFRTAAALGVGGVILDPTCADPWYRRSVRVSMGAVCSLPFARAEVWPDTLRLLADRGFEVVALTPAGPERLDAVRCEHRRPAILVGAEGPGLSREALDAATRRVRIPMAGGMDSLNVGHAAAIACHHLVTVSRRGGPAEPRDAR